MTCTYNRSLIPQAHKKSIGFAIINRNSYWFPSTFSDCVEFCFLAVSEYRSLTKKSRKQRHQSCADQCHAASHQLFHPQLAQLMTLKHGTTIFCFHFTKVCLEIFNTSTFGQFHRSSHVCTPNQLILQIQNLWKKMIFSFPQYWVRSSKFFLRFDVCGTSVSNTKTTVVPA